MKGNFILILQSYEMIINEKLKIKYLLHIIFIQKKNQLANYLFESGRNQTDTYTDRDTGKIQRLL